MTGKPSPEPWKESSAGATGLHSKLPFAVSDRLSVSSHLQNRGDSRHYSWGSECRVGGSCCYPGVTAVGSDICCTARRSVLNSTQTEETLVLTPWFSSAE